MAKTCSDCNFNKKNEEFPIHHIKNGVITYRIICKECYNKERRDKWEAQKEKAPKNTVIDLPEEIWKDIEGWEGLYLVSNKGRIKSIIGRYGFEKLIKPINKKGYLGVNLSYKYHLSQKLVHVLVGKTFIDNPFDKPEINHINGDKKDNNVENLEWATKSENILHAIKLGLKKILKGENHPFCKLSDEDIRIIFFSKLSVANICKKYDISDSYVRNIKAAKRRVEAIYN